MTDSITARDYLGHIFVVGDTIAVSTSQGIRVGKVLELRYSEGYYDGGGELFLHSVQINREFEPGRYRKQTFQYSGGYQKNFYRIGP